MRIGVRAIKVLLYRKFEPIYLFIFQKLEKRKYLCLTDYDEPYDFHCVQGQPKSGDKWFTICGTPYPVRAEYILLTCTVALIGISWFWQLLRNPSSLSRKQIYETTDKPKIN